MKRPHLVFVPVAAALLVLVVIMLMTGRRERPSPQPPAAAAPVISNDKRVKFVKEKPKPLPEIDLRHRKGPAPAPAADRTGAFAALKRERPMIQAQFDEISGAPSHLQETGKFLTGKAAGQTPKEIVSAYVDRFAALFGHNSDALKAARVTREDVTKHNGMTTVVWQQQHEGIPLYNTIFKANVTQDGEIITLSDHFLGNPAAATGGQDVQPDLTVQQAVSKAAMALGSEVPPGAIQAVDAATGAELKQRFAAEKLSDTTAHLTWLPLSADNMRLAWDVTTFSLERNEMYQSVVDAETGEILLRRSLTSDISDATYRIYTTESPSPFSPGHETPSSLQPAYVNRVLYTTQAINTTASPNGWIDDGNMETNGNNVDAHTDTDNNNVADLPRPNGGAGRVFDFPMDLTQAPSTYKDASVTQLFYWCNFMHDRMYEMGFTESAGNFQVNNFGRGGNGNDPVQADAQDGSGTDNANFSTPADGSSGRMQMYLWTGPSPDRDGSFEAEVVLHEYGHGVSNRLVGGGVGISALSSRGMGEGWSDFYGLALTAEAADNPHGNWARAGYSRYLTSGWLSENYYYGARRYSYSTDMLKNPHTFKDIDPTQVDWHTAVPRNPTYAATQDATQVHYQGTVWAVMLWDMRANLILKHGFAIGNDRAIRLVTDGMKLSPVNPNFVQARDGIIQATLVSFPGDMGEVWTAFAKRGMGQGATAPASSTTTGVVESYLVPDGLQINDRSGWNITGNKGGPFTPATKVLTLSNNSAGTVNWSVNTNAAWLSANPSSGTLAAGANVAVTITTQADAMVPGFHSTNIVFTNTGTSFNQPVGVRLYVTPPAVQTFNLSSDPGWTRTGEWAFGTPTGGGGGTGNADPTSGATGANVFGVNLSGNHSTSITGPHYLTTGVVDLSLYTKTRLRFKRWLNTNSLTNSRVTVEVTKDGTNWREVYVNPGSAVTDSAWQTLEYDISSIADLQSAVQVRWSYQVIVANAYSGWNIDDVEFLGESTNSFTINSASNATEGDAPVTATLTMSIAQASPLTVTLASSDPTAATVPASVTLNPGETSTTFQIMPVDDVLADGSQTTVITATATGVGTGTKNFSVQDNETAILTLSLPASVTEGGTAGSGTVTRSDVNSSAVMVALSSSDPTAATVPDVVVIPAGQASVTFSITAVNDTKIDGTQSTTISAAVANWTGASGSVDVLDNENLNLTMSAPALVTEGGTGVGSVSISGTLTTALTVNLSSNQTKLTVPASVTIPAGATSVGFTATAPNDTLAEANVTATITASAAGFNDGTGSTTVIDNDLHHFSFATISSPKTLGSPFSITITALNLSNYTVTGFTGTTGLSGTGASGAISMTPTTTTAFSSGVWTGSITINTATTNIVLTANDGSGHTGTSNSFTVGAGSLHHFAFSNITSPKTTGTPFSTTITAQDIANNTVTSFASTATLSAYRLAPLASSIVISELNPNTPDEVEFMNVGTGPVDISGWQIYLYDNVSQSSPLAVFTIPAGTICAAGQIFRLQEFGTAPGTFPLFFYGSNVDWTSSSGSRSAVLLRNASGTAVDFMCANASTSTAISSPQTIPTTEWSGASISVPANTSHGYLRIGSIDNSTAADWTTATPSIGTANTGLTTPFNGMVSVAMTPTTSGSFSAGVWTGNVTVNQAATQAQLRAVNGTSTGDSNAFTVNSTVTANAQSVTVPYNTPTAVTLSGQDSAAPGATLTYAVVTNPTNGVLSGTAPNLTYTPNSGYQGSDSFTFTAANGVNVSNPATVSITVQPPPPEIVVEQPEANGLTDGVSTVDYGTIPTGSGTVRTFTVKNIGTMDLVVSGITKDGTNSSDITIGTISSSTITSGSSATFTVTFTPAAATVRSAAIHILSNDADEASFDIALTATGSAAFPDIAIEQPAGTARPDDAAIVDFSLTTLGTPVTRTFTIQNTGGTTLTISGVTIDGTASSQFAAGAVSSTTIPVAGSTTLAVTFTPTSAGAKLAALHVLSNDPDEASYDIELHGIGSILPGPVTLPRDINASANGGTFTNFVLSGSNAYYLQGTSLYRTNGTAAGTSLIATVASTAASSVAVIGSNVFFVASDSNGSELWSYNGTTSARLADINPGTSSSTPALMTVVGTTLYFTALTATNGTELWKSDGTTGGTVLVKDIFSGTSSSSITGLTNVNGTLFFAATDGTNGVELWKSDGTAAGTVMVSNINTAAGSSSSPANLTAIGSTVYFSASNGTTTGLNGTELWKSDGTSGGTVMVADIFSGTSSSSPASLFNWNGVLYFRASTTAAGAELYKSDGTSAGTVLVKDIFSGTTSSTPANFASNGTTLFFSAMDSTSNGAELWKTDGTSAGTVMVKNINATTNGSSNPASLTVVGSTLYFSAADGVNGVELWKSDGTSAGTVMVEDIVAGSGASSPGPLFNLNSLLLFGATDVVTGLELWRSDGTMAGTYRLVDNFAGTSSSSPANITALGSQVLYSAFDGANGTELWSSDGTTAGTALLKDIHTTAGFSSFPSNFTLIGSTVFFSAADATNGTELWKTDGTTAGTVLVSNIFAGSTSSSPTVLRNVAGTLFFAATDTTANGQELWKSDGTAGGTVMVKNINPTANASSSISSSVAVGSLLYFSANDGTNGAELWMSDGTSAGTVMVKNINPAAGTGSSVTSITAVGSTVYFVANDGTTGSELWKSDGTDAGTVLVKDIQTGITSSSVFNLAAYNGVLYFSASDGVNGAELWRSDGTDAGTYMFKELNPGSGSSTPSNMRVHNSILYFAASDGLGSELWRTDGTAAGTWQVRDINPGSASSSPANLVSVGTRLYFSATTSANGSELWRTDGTSIGTQLVSDLVPGTTSSAPSQLVQAGARLFFVAAVTGVGAELFTYDLGSAPEIAVYEGPDTTGVEHQDNTGTYSFGSQTTSVTRSFTLKNTGAGYLFVSDITVSGAQADAFFAAGKPDPSTPIQPGATATFTVTATLEGPPVQNAVVSILCNDSDEASFDIPVTITVDDTIPPVISAPATYLIGQPGTLAMSLPDLRGIVIYSDNRPGDGLIVQDPIPGDIVLGIGQTATVTFTATDESGNASNTVTTQVQMGLGQPNTGGTAWARAGGGIGSDGASTSRVAATPDGGAVVAGVFSSPTFTLGSGADAVTLTQVASTDVFVAKFAKDGTLQWARSAGSNSTDAISAVRVLSDGSIAVAGTYSTSITFSGTTLTGASGDSFIVRYLPDGTLAWAKGFGGTGTDSVTHLVQLTDGSLVTAGTYSTTPTITLATGVTLSNIGSSFTDLFVIKYQLSDGTALWARSLGSSTTFESSLGLQLAASPDGGVVVAGGMLSSTLSITGTATTLTNSGASGSSDWFAAKFDTAGTFQWARNAGGGTGTDTPSVLKAFSNGDMLITGTTSSASATFGAGGSTQQVYTNLGSSDVVLARLASSTGAQLWARRAAGIGTDAAVDLLVMADDSVVLTGNYSNGSMQLGSGEAHATTLTASVSSSKLFIANFSGSDGTLRWAKTTGGSASEAPAATSLAVLGDDIGLAGVFQTPSTIFGPGEAAATTLVNAGTGADVFVAKFSRVDGSLIWAKRGGSANIDSVHAMTALKNGSAMVVGTFQPPSATFGLGESGEVTMLNAEASGTNTDLFFARFHGGGVEPPDAPVVTLLPASALSPSSMTFNASIESRAQDTTVVIEYGPTTSYGTSVPVTDVSAGFGAETRSLSLTGLAPLTTVNFRVVATNPGGTTTSANQSITTYPDAEIVVEQPDGTGLTDGSSTISFGSVAIGGSSTRTFTIRNVASTGTLTGMALSKDGAAAADYTLGTLGATSLAPGESTTFNVTFSPSSGGTRSSALHIASNDGDENPFDIVLSGDNYTNFSFASSSTVPVTSSGYTVPAGRSLGLGLAFAPATGAVLTVIDNTGSTPISGTFVDLPEGGIVTATFGGVTYFFHASYQGGDGNDLVLSRAYDWTWMKGSNSTANTGFWAAQGVADPANTPIGRNGGMTWTDTQGNLWYFGGGIYADLWRFNRATAVWTMVKTTGIGSSQNGIYGTQGVATSANNPGSRNGGVTWIDSAGKLWLFGGFGYPATGTTTGYLNDLWRYDPATNMWTWIAGGSGINTNGTYGTQGSPSASNVPGSRSYATAWMDTTGNLWLFGGYGYPATGSTTGYLNDLWKYDPLTSQWTWIKGGNITYVNGTYGTMGIPAAANTPGTRTGAAGWLDDQGRFWLFGGTGYGNSIFGGPLGDLWCYDPASNMWAWINGTASSSANQNGVYGRQGVAAASNAPGYRSYPATWRDARGRLWLHGGTGRSSIGTTVAQLNDLWFYDIISNQWTWVMGGQTHLNNGVYGSLGVPAAGNLPGARSQASSFATNQAIRDFWVFGGLGVGATGSSTSSLNDVWVLDTPSIPTVTTLAATGVTAIAATLNANVIPDGQTTSLRFRLGTAPNLAGAAVSSWQSVGSSTVNGTLAVGPLNYSTTYYYQAEVVNSSGMASGSILSFTTLDAPDIVIEQPAGTPLIDGGAAAVDFGVVGTGATSMRTFTLKNTGTAALNITGSSTDGIAAADYAVSGLPVTLAIGGNTTFTVTFTGSATGSRPAVLHIGSDDPDESPFDIPVIATATPAAYTNWGASAGLNASNNAPAQDADLDGINNLLEFAFGLNPTSNDAGFVTITNGTLSQRGTPVPRVEAQQFGVNYQAAFCRSNDATSAGYSYTVQFSGDLITWFDSTATPTVQASDGGAQAVTVPYPFLLPNRQKARFFRVVVSPPP
ncbi:MAG: ELWxxDGT repeat protein [Verrucomicrobiaceae bacterium]